MVDVTAFFSFKELDEIAGRAASIATRNHSQDYQDAKQEAFIYLLENKFSFDTGRPRASCVSYLVCRIGYALLRRRQQTTGARLKSPPTFTRPETLETVGDAKSDPAEIAEAREERLADLAAIRQTLETFQPLEREALVCFLRGEKPPVISRAFGVNRPYLYRLITRFRRRLKKTGRADHGEHAAGDP